MPDRVRVLNEDEAKPETFHDCHVEGFHWSRERFTFSLVLGYILEWLGPNAPETNYRFSVSRAHLTFRNVDDVRLYMEWSGSALDAQIESLQVTDSRPTPTGPRQRRFEITFADPEGRLLLWSSGYQVTLLGEPVLSKAQRIEPLEDQR